MYLIIDGLDECSGRKSLLSTLLEFNVRNIKILVTSRPELDIKEVLSTNHSLNIDDHVVNDIVTYVRWEIESDPKLSKIEQRLKQEIQDQLIAKSDGMYSSYD